MYFINDVCSNFYNMLAQCFRCMGRRNMHLRNGMVYYAGNGHIRDKPTLVGEHDFRLTQYVCWSNHVMW